MQVGDSLQGLPIELESPGFARQDWKLSKGTVTIDVWSSVNPLVGGYFERETVLEGLHVVLVTRFDPAGLGIKVLADGTQGFTLPLSITQIKSEVIFCNGLESCPMAQ